MTDHDLEMAWKTWKISHPETAHLPPPGPDDPSTPMLKEWYAQVKPHVVEYAEQVWAQALSDVAEQKRRSELATRAEQRGRSEQTEEKVEPSPELLERFTPQREGESKLQYRLRSGGVGKETK